MPDDATAPAPPGDRLRASERREALLDVTRALLVEGGPREITMGTVAERAEVTRALVYKHFADKHDLLRALYQREARRLDRALETRVAQAPDGLEPKLRALVQGTLDAVDAHGSFFGPLRALGMDTSTRRDRRRWNRRTLDYFADLAASTHDLDPATARSATAMLLSGIDSLVAQAGTARDEAQRQALEDTYVELTLGGLERLAGR